MSEGQDSRVALVTGGYGGLGTAICKAFARDGYKVVSSYRAPERKAHAVEWQQKMAADGLEVGLVCMDVSDPESCRSGANDLLEQYGRLDVLVNNAGITRDSVMKKMTVEQWHDVIHTNLDSVFNVTHPFLNKMLEQGVRTYCQHILGQRAERAVRTGELFRRQGRHSRFHQGPCPGSRAQGDHCQYCLPWLCGDRHGHVGVRGSAG